ncbi:hypothetical protein PM082_016821 [Marasmius tenuissimus]|nr:hypothetical protein PM082_016821 [Marasmius tenuissimus]
MLPLAGSKANVSWSRDPSKNPPSFSFVWVNHTGRPTGNTGVNVGVTNSTTAGSKEVPYPSPGRYKLSIFEALNVVSYLDDPLFTNKQETIVLAPDGSALLSSELSTPPSSVSSTSGEDSNTALPSSTPPESASQTRSSMSVPIVVGTIGGSLMLGLMAFIIRYYFRKRRSTAGRQTSSLDIDPFLTQLSEKNVVSSKSDGIAAQRPQQPEPDTVAQQGPDTTKPESPPSIDPPENASATRTPTVAQNTVEGLVNVAPSSRREMQVLTTDELAVELNQRLQEEGRWDVDESLPGYPESNHGRSRS